MRENMENLIKSAKELDCGNYYLNCSQVLYLAERCNNNFINGSLLLFKIGFLKGQRSEKKRKKTTKR